MNHLKAKQVAKLFGVSVMTISRWVKAGHLKAMRTPGGRYLFDPQQINAELAKLGLPLHETPNEK